MKILAYNAPWYSGIEIGIIDRKKKEVAVKLVKKPYTEGDIIEPLMRLTIDEASDLMNALWYCGIRPTNGEGSVGELKATQNHLKDMQKLVFSDKKVSAHIESLSTDKGEA